MFICLYIKKNKNRIEQKTRRQKTGEIVKCSINTLEYSTGKEVDSNR